MPSTYSPDLRLELIGTGDQAGVWGSTTNTNLGTLIENAVAGYTSVSIIASPQALTAVDGVADEARYAVLALTTSTGADFTVAIPPNSKQYTFYNASSYVATISNSTVKNGVTLSGGTTVAIPAGKTMTVWSDGTNVAQQNDHLISPTMATPALGTPASGTLTNTTGFPIANLAGAGTGVLSSLAVNVGSAGAPVINGGALGTPASGTLTNATGLPIVGGTTGTLSVARGGTGATTLSGVAYGNGTSAMTAATAAQIVSAIGSTAVANAANGGVTSVNSSTGAIVLANLYAFWNSLGTNGYQRLPGGLLIQWGISGTVGVDSYIDVAMTTTFTTAFCVVGSVNGGSITGGANMSVGLSFLNNSTIRIYNDAGSTTVAWIALGTYS